MRKSLISLTCTVALVFGASTASALSIGDSNYLGSIVPGTPTSPGHEVSYLTFLISMSTPSGPILSGGQTYTRSANTCAGLFGGNPCPAATLVGADADNQTPNPTGPVSVNATGFAYLYGKYGGKISHVWVIAGMGTVTLPQKSADGNNLSHWSLYTPYTPTSVPDGGATLGLLGLAMLGLGYLRQRNL